MESKLQESSHATEQEGSADGESSACDLATSHQQHKAHGELLNKIYSVQRHFYDLTRKYYLFGRDRVLQEIIQYNPDSILEIGCGTGRNLFKLEKMLRSSSMDMHHERTPALCGLDASTEMLAYASKHRPIGSDIALGFGYAESFSPQELFARDTFSDILFSYSLSMIPESILALEHALTLLAPEGRIWIVDFWDQSGYPRWFQKLLQWWLELFHVRFDPALFSHIKDIQRAPHKDAERTSRPYSITIQPVGRNYAYLACITRNASESDH